MSDPVIDCFREDFERFFSLLKQQVEVCPDDLWATKAGGSIFWQQLLHAFACIELYALPEGEPSRQTLYPRDVVMLSATPDRTMTKAEMYSLAADVKLLADAFIAGQTAATLTARHSGLSKALGRELTNQHALLGLVRHACYHLGSCDAVLRDHGIAGVY